MITNFEETDAAYGTVVQGNYIGTDITGTIAMRKLHRHRYRRRVVEPDRHRRAGWRRADALEGNLISGNLTAGIMINAAAGPLRGNETLAGASDNVVAGNLIGTNAAGTAALGNGADGVELEGGATSTSIGVNAVYGPENADEGNIISASPSTGVWLDGGGTSANTVAGNYIGTDVSGTIALANSLGVYINGGASGNTIGGTAAGAGNVISGNSGDGVDIRTRHHGQLVDGQLDRHQRRRHRRAGQRRRWRPGRERFLGQHDRRDGAGAGNLISGNTNGVEINDSSGNLVQGNLIGIDQTGTRRPRQHGRRRPGRRRLLGQHDRRGRWARRAT